jgi:hypothetical protein
MTVYTLKKKGNTGELHMFEATPSKTEPGSCTPAQNSICRKMKSSESTENKFACESEWDARVKAAGYGRDVCGICISSLYATYP